MIGSPFLVQLQVCGFFYSMLLFECHHLCSGKRSEGYALRRSSLKYNTRDGTETSSAQNLISLNNLETDEQREQLGEIEVEGSVVTVMCVGGWVSSVCLGG